MPDKETMEIIVTTMQKAGMSFEDVGRAMREYRNTVLAMFTIPELQEAKASGVPLLDYWAFWESRGYKSPRFKR